MPPRIELEVDDGLVGEQLVLDDVAGHDARSSSATSSPTTMPAQRRPPSRPRPQRPAETAWTKRTWLALGSLDRVTVERVLLAEPRGFCAGVEMAIKALAWMVRVFEPPVYCYHEIVHNRLVVEEFRAPGRRSSSTTSTRSRRARR